MTIYAQESATPQAEVGFTYSYTRVNPGGAVPSYNENGGSGYVEYNLSRVVGLVADLGASQVGGAGAFNLDNTAFMYLFGPRFNWRLKRITPYVEALVGGARSSYGANSVLSASGLAGTQNNFAAAMGGGIDVALTAHLAVKPIQVEYLMTQYPNTGTNLTSVQNDLRYSAGVVLRFGSK
jgi:opacity protein-like surface antigen